MSDEETFKLAGCFPHRDGDREKLKLIMHGRPIPAKVPDSIVVPCHKCGMELEMGPRLVKVRETEAPDMQPVCPWCFVTLMGEYRGTNSMRDLTITNLGNPQSQWDCQCGAIVPLTETECPHCWVALPRIENRNGY